MAEAFIWYEITKGFTMRQIEGLSKRSWGSRLCKDIHLRSVKTSNIYVRDRVRSRLDFLLKLSQWRFNSWTILLF